MLQHQLESAEFELAAVSRDLLPAWAVDELLDYWPACCGCGHVFAEAERIACRDPARHQVEELPRIAV